jgi:hypothetical protein
MLKSQDESIGEQNGRNYFNSLNKIDNNQDDKITKKRHTKKTFLKDLEREMILDRMKNVDTPATDEEMLYEKNDKILNDRKGYFDEQEEIKKNISDAINISFKEKNSISHKMDEETDLLIFKKRSNEQQVIIKILQIINTTVNI